MSTPVAPGGSSIPRMNFGANALAAPTSPERRLPVVDKSKVDPQLLKAAEGMEAMFLDYMMKVMRDTVPKSEMSMESPATRIYTSMMDSEVAKTAARVGGIGLADQIIAYWEAGRYNKPSTVAPLKAAPAQASKSESPDQVRDTGGIHEDRPDTQQSDTNR